VTDAGGRDKTDAGPTAIATAETFDIALFARIDRPAFQRNTIDLVDLTKLLTTFQEVPDKKLARCWSPTRYAADANTRGNIGVEAVSCLVFDLDRVPPDPKRLEHVHWIGHTTWSHRSESPRWRVVVPLARPLPSATWADVWQRARAALCPEADPACKDPSRAYWVPSNAPGVQPEHTTREGNLLDPDSLPSFPREPKRPTRISAPVRGDRRRGEAYMARVVDNLVGAQPGGRNAALNHAAWTLGRWVVVGALEQACVEDALYAAAERNGLVSDDGQRQTWATIRSGINAGLSEAATLTPQ
jgi:hypothetical protein